MLSVVATIAPAIPSGSRGGANRVTGVICGCVLVLPVLIVVAMNVLPAPR